MLLGMERTMIWYKAGVLTQGRDRPQNWLTTCFTAFGWSPVQCCKFTSRCLNNKQLLLVLAIWPGVETKKKPLTQGLKLANTYFLDYLWLSLNMFLSSGSHLKFLKINVFIDSNLVEELPTLFHPKVRSDLTCYLPFKLWRNKNIGSSYFLSQVQQIQCMWQGWNSKAYI